MEKLNIINVTYSVRTFFFIHSICYTFLLSMNPCLKCTSVLQSPLRKDRHRRCHSWTTQQHHRPERRLVEADMSADFKGPSVTVGVCALVCPHQPLCFLSAMHRKSKMLCQAILCSWSVLLATGLACTSSASRQHCLCLWTVLFMSGISPYLHL